MLTELVATLATGLFTGAAIYINVVEHPARRQGGLQVALTEFAPSYHRATVMQVALAIVGFVSAVLSWRFTSDVQWLVGGGLLISVIPFTAVALLPTNKQLLDPATAEDGERAERLLTRWGRRHAVRSMLSLAAFLLFISLLTIQQG